MSDVALEHKLQKPVITRYIQINLQITNQINTELILSKKSKSILNCKIRNIKIIMVETLKKIDTELFVFKQVLNSSD